MSFPPTRLNVYEVLLVFFNDWKLCLQFILKPSVSLVAFNWKLVKFLDRLIESASSFVS